MDTEVHVRQTGGCGADVGGSTNELNLDGRRLATAVVFEPP